MRGGIERVLAHALRPLRNRINSLVTRVILDAVSDGSGFQVVKVLALEGEVIEGLEHLQPGGLSHVPGSGAEAVMLRIGKSHAVVLCASNRDKRPKNLQAGETALWTLANGIRVLCKANGEVHIAGNGTTGDAADFVPLAALVLAELNKIKTAFDTHTHGGVTAGAAVTLTPAVPMPAPASVAATLTKAS